MSIQVTLWGVKRRLLSYLEELAAGNPVVNAESMARVTAAIEYAMVDLEDRDYQHAFANLQQPDPKSLTWSIEEEVVNYSTY